MGGHILTPDRALLCVLSVANEKTGLFPDYAELSGRLIGACSDLVSTYTWLSVHDRKCGHTFWLLIRALFFGCDTAVTGAALAGDEGNCRSDGWRVAANLGESTRKDTVGGVDTESAA